MGKDALKEVVMRAQSPSFLHLATHGFFGVDQKDSATPPPKKKKYNIHRGFEMQYALESDPMFQSGLVMAGANVSEQNLLTAYEICEMDLRDTQLVVLSACESAQGKEDDGGGVWGMQSAFRQAGARSLIMSVTKVQDEATVTFFRHFYSFWSQGQSVNHAFASTLKLMKKSAPNPLDWGAFILIES